MSQQPDRRQYNTDDEIDLVDLWLSVRRHSVAFLAVLISSALVGVGLALLVPEKFAHKIVLEIGGVQPGGAALASSNDQDFRPIENPESVREKIEMSYVPEELRRFEMESPDENVPDKVDVETPEDTRLVSLSVSAPAVNTEVVIELLANVADRVLVDHNALLSRRVDLLHEVASDRLRELDAQLESLQDSRRQVAASGTAAEKGLTLLMVDAQIQRVIAERNEIARHLRVDLEVNAQPTRIVIGPVRRSKPEPPGPLLLIALSLLIGVVLGFVVVLLAEMRQKANERSRATG